jgi:hypothetical protein
MGGKIHATRHWRVVGFNDPNVFECPEANKPSEGFSHLFKNSLTKVPPSVVCLLAITILKLGL